MHSLVRTQALRDPGPLTVGVSSRVDAFASEAHYLDHLLPLWDALPTEVKGTLYVTRPLHGEGRTLGFPRGDGPPVLVASLKDSLVCKTRKRIYLEHGAGQTYEGDPRAARNGAYSGGEGHEGTILFLCPNEEVAERWRRRYPDVPAVAIGSPRLDRYKNYKSLCKTGRPPAGILAAQASGQAHGAGADSGSSSAVEKSAPLTIAISFHWHCTICPEADWAFPHYERILPELAERYTLIGHGHPRSFRYLAHRYKRLGIEAVQSFDEVVRRASVYVCDNSSTMYEVAALGIPVVALNAPWYRRDVHHGLRFWNRVPGLQCDEPEELIATIEEALDDPPHARAIRERAVLLTYPFFGSAASRGTDAILGVLEREQTSGKPLSGETQAP